MHYIIFKQFLSCVHKYLEIMFWKNRLKICIMLMHFSLGAIDKDYGWKVMNEKSSNCSSAVFCELIRSNDFSDVMEKETQFTNCIEMNSHTSAKFLALLQWNSLKQSWIILAFLGSISISSWGFFFWFTCY